MPAEEVQAVEPWGLPPVDELRESLMQTVDVLRAYLQRTEQTLGGESGRAAATAERDLAAVYASLEVEADKSPGWKELEAADV